MTKDVKFKLAHSKNNVIVLDDDLTFDLKNHIILIKYMCVAAPTYVMWRHFLKAPLMLCGGTALWRHCSLEALCRGTFKVPPHDTFSASTWHFQCLHITFSVPPHYMVPPHYIFGASRKCLHITVCLHITFLVPPHYMFGASTLHCGSTLLISVAPHYVSRWLHITLLVDPQFTFFKTLV